MADRSLYEEANKVLTPNAFEFVLDSELVPVVPTQRGPFQGWRYLKPDEAPADLERGDDGELPPDEMLKELRSLGLI